MKILIVHDYGTPTGGAELQVLKLRDGLRARGHEVRLFSSTAKSVPSEIVADYTCFGTTHPQLQVLSQTVNPSAYLNLRRVLREFQPDIVHVRMFLWQLSPAILPLLRRIPSLYHVSVHKPVCPLGSKMLPDGSRCHDPAGVACLRNGCLSVQAWPVLMLQMKLWQKQRPVFNRVITLSQAMKTQLEENGLTPVEVVYNGIEERPARPPLTQPPIAAYAGRLVTEKGVDVLLEAFARVIRSVPDAQLWIAGHGPERANLEALANRLGIGAQVQFLGYLPRAELEKRFEAAWVQVIPSRWEEPFGNVATESMMRGTAVITSAVGGLAEIVADTGVLVPPGDIDALTLALHHVLGDREAAERMGQEGRMRAITCFSHERTLDSIEALYHELVSNKTQQIQIEPPREPRTTAHPER